MIRRFPCPPRALGGSGPLPRTAPVPPLRIRNSPRTQTLQPIKPQQQPSDTGIVFKTSPHQRVLKSKNLPSTLTVMSHWKPVVAQTTTIQLSLIHVKILPKTKTTRWIYQPSLKKSKISKRSSPKRYLSSTHQGKFSPRSTSSILRSSRGESQP